MARSSTPSGSMRQRNVAPRKPADGAAFQDEPELDKLVKAAAQKKSVGSEMEHRIGLILITILAFVTRFWGISHPNEVVFDEVHFGKVTWSHFGSTTALV